VQASRASTRRRFCTLGSEICWRRVHEDGAERLAAVSSDRVRGSGRGRTQVSSSGATGAATGYSSSPPSSQLSQPWHPGRAPRSVAPAGPANLATGTASGPANPQWAELPRTVCLSIVPEAIRRCTLLRGYIATDISDLAADLAAAAKDNHTGVGVFIDEMQDADEDVLAALCAAVHNAAQRNLPFYVVGAGLPSLPGVLSTAATYAECMFEYRTIEHLDDADSRRVLTDPADTEGVQWEDAATTLIANEANGYPYFLQEYGRAAWDVAPGPTITYSDVLIAITDGREALDAGSSIPAGHERHPPNGNTSRQWLTTGSDHPSPAKSPAGSAARSNHLDLPGRTSSQKASSTPPNTAKFPTQFPVWPTS